MILQCSCKQHCWDIDVNSPDTHQRQYSTKNCTQCICTLKKKNILGHEICREVFPTWIMRVKENHDNVLMIWISVIKSSVYHTGSSFRPDTAQSERTAHINLTAIRMLPITLCCFEPITCQCISEVGCLRGSQPLAKSES